MIERGIPLPPPDTANERAHRLDAEAAAFMEKHANGIINAWLTCGDPTTYAAWHEASVRQHWPELWSRWRALQQAQERMTSLVYNEHERRKPRRPL